MSPCHGPKIDCDWFCMTTMCLHGVYSHLYTEHYLVAIISGEF